MSTSPKMPPQRSEARGPERELRIPDTTPEQLAKALLSGGRPRTGDEAPCGGSRRRAYQPTKAEMEEEWEVPEMSLEEAAKRVLAPVEV